MTSTNNHKTVIVKKPWGYEYLAFSNEYAALWVLHIEPGERTSMHCHPNKSTGLVVLSGEAEINFISDSKRLTGPAKQMIRRGLFHQTYSVGPEPVVMFEVETPVDKDDLVRLHDNYGRKNNGYEDHNYQLPKHEECLWINEQPALHAIAGRTISVEKPTTKNWLSNKNPDSIIMFLRGGLVKTVNDTQYLVTRPGDVGLVKVVDYVAQEMEGFEANTTILVIE